MSTYVPITSRTLSTSANSVTFTGIPQTYTDIVIVFEGTADASNVKTIKFNGDTGSNYSSTTMTGASSGALSGRYTNSYLDVVNSGTNRQMTTVSIMNYSNTTTKKTYLSRHSCAANSTEMIIGLWNSTAAITSIEINTGTANSFNAGCTFSLYGIGAGTAKATGGEVTISGGYAYHTFKQSGTFTPLVNMNVDYLVVAGGGGTILQASGYYSGGGGGGGVRSSVSPTGGGGSVESALSVTANTTYPVIVGAGAASLSIGRGDGKEGIQGNNSTFATITSTGGGYGSVGPGITSKRGGNGGSGGGSGSNNGAPFTSYAGGDGTPGQGYNGGANETSDAYAAGAGGGAGGAGGAAGDVSAGKGGTGGAALQNSISGVATYYAGGGYGGRGFYGAGTVGNAGTGYNQNPNTGMGGIVTNAAGQSGIVIVRYTI